LNIKIIAPSTTQYKENCTRVLKKCTVYINQSSNNQVKIKTIKPPNVEPMALPTIAWYICCGLFKFLDSITAGTDEDSPGIPNVIAGILPMYCDIVVSAVYRTIICKGSR